MKKMILVSLSLVVIGMTGCAGMRASQARDAELSKLARAHTYKQSCQDVWGATRTMLFAQNYQVKSADAAAGLTLETEWKDEKEGAATRYMFQGSAPAEKECKVVATRASKTAKGDTSMDRDWKMEWNLIKQVDMTVAQEYEAEANKAGDAARNQK